MTELNFTPTETYILDSDSTPDLDSIESSLELKTDAQKVIELIRIFSNESSNKTANEKYLMQKDYIHLVKEFRNTKISSDITNNVLYGKVFSGKVLLSYIVNETGSILGLYQPKIRSKDNYQIRRIVLRTDIITSGIDLTTFKFSKDELFELGKCFDKYIIIWLSLLKANTNNKTIYKTVKKINLLIQRYGKHHSKEGILEELKLH